MKAVATTVVAAKTIEETAEAEPGPTLRGQLAVASPVVPPSSAACCSPRRTWDGCDRRHQTTPSRLPAASAATCSLQAVTPFQRPASLAEDAAPCSSARRCTRSRRAVPRHLAVLVAEIFPASYVPAGICAGVFSNERPYASWAACRSACRSWPPKPYPKHLQVRRPASGRRR